MEISYRLEKLSRRIIGESPLKRAESLGAEVEIIYVLHLFLRDRSLNEVVESEMLPTLAHEMILPRKRGNDSQRHARRILARFTCLAPYMLGHANDILHQPVGLGKYRGVHSLKNVSLAAANDQKGIVYMSVAIGLTQRRLFIKISPQRIRGIYISVSHFYTSLLFYF